MSPWVFLAFAGALLVLPGRTSRQRAQRLTTRRQGVSRQRPLGGPITAAAAAGAAGCALTAGYVLPTAAGALVAALAWHKARLRAQAAKRARAAQEVADGIDALVAALRSGAHPAQALAQAAAESTPAVAAVFTRASRQAGIGADVAAGFAFADRDLPTLAQVGAAWSIAHHGGIALTDSLAAVRADVVARLAFQRRTTAALAGARATTHVLAALPLLGIGLGHLMGAGPLRFLLDTPHGGVLLLTGVTLACGGILWADAITGKAAR